MILCFDLGNTRWKWGVYESGLLVDSGVLLKSVTEARQALQEAKQTDTELAPPNRQGIEVPVESDEPDITTCLAQLKQIHGDSIHEVWASSVAEIAVQDLVNDACEQTLGLSVMYAHVYQHFAGVSAAYKKVSNLGVDRWLALLGAWRKFGGNCVVLDAGSALTADYLSAEGEHLGGLIAPGLRLMENALFDKTARVKPVNLVLPEEWSPQSDTMPCVEHGLAAMFAGFVSQVEQFHKDFKLILTGGDAPLAACFACGETVIAPHLVLEGLLYYREFRQSELEPTK